MTIRGDNLGKSPADVVQVLIAGVDCTPTLTWMSSHKLMVTTRAGVGNVFEERGGGGRVGEGRGGGAVSASTTRSDAQRPGRVCTAF